MRFKIVIIQSDPLEAKITAERFAAFGCIVLGIGRTAEDAQVLCRTCRPDVLIMDPFLPGMNCDELTRRLEQDLEHPLIKIVISSSKNDAIADQFYNYGGDLFLLTPVDHSYCVDQMKKYLQLRSKQGAPLTEEPVIRGCARKFLLRMKMPMTVHGFVYILDASELLLARPDYFQNLVDGLYTDIGLLHGKTYQTIERCIRNAVEKTFERGDVTFLYEHFGDRVRERTGKPTNGDFLTDLTEMIRYDLTIS